MARLLTLMLLALTGLYGHVGVEVRTTRFRVITELPEQAALEAAKYLETAHAALKAAGIEPRPVGYEPIPVLLLPSVEKLETLFASPIVAGGFARGLFQPGVDRPYIVLSWEPPETARIALGHEYVHWVFKGLTQPLWYREGMAEYLSRSILLSNGAVFGSPPAHFLEPLRTETWIPLQRLLTAQRERDLVTSPTFYGQCWLIAHWLVSQVEPGTVPSHETFLELVQRKGEATAEALLREYLQELLSGQATTTTVSFVRPDVTSFARRPLAVWEWRYYLADAWREAPAWEKAEPELKGLEREFPSRPEPSESLGALQMDRKDYDAAEQSLASAIAKGSMNPRTHHRYALMLLRPVDEGAERRSALARDHAREALRRQPGEPAYILTEAQALGLLGDWSAAAERLSHLAAYPGWKERAETEFEVLLHRRRRHVENLPRPYLAGANASGIDLAFLANEPEPIAAPLPPAKQPEVWPPAGTVLLYGHIVKIECRKSEKIVTVRTPRWPILLRERDDAPARLLSPPQDWKTLPCEADRWEVNVAYRPNLKNRRVRGDIVAIVF